MNVFEDLVVELKEENLLEETFIDLPVAVKPDSHSGNGHSSTNGNVQFASPSTPGFGVVDPVINRERLSEQIAAIELVDLVLTAIASENGIRGNAGKSTFKVVFHNSRIIFSIKFCTSLSFTNAISKSSCVNSG